MTAIYLVIYVYAGMLAKGDSVSLVTIPQVSMEQCQANGEKASELVAGSTKSVRYLCLEGIQK